MGATLRMMGGRGWPGLESGGVAWFTDLTQVSGGPGVDSKTSYLSLELYALWTCRAVVIVDRCM